MGSDSDLESLNLSDFEGEVDEDSSDEKNDSESGQVPEPVVQEPLPEPEKPKPASMAARMTAARAAKRSRASIRKPPASPSRQASKADRRKKKDPEKTPESPQPRKRGRPKKNPAPKKRNAASQEPEAMQSTPPVISVDDSDDSKSDSSSESSSDDGGVELIEKPHPMETPERDKLLARQTHGTQKGVPEQSTQEDSPNDDVPLKRLQTKRRTASRARKPATPNHEHSTPKKSESNVKPGQKESIPRGEETKTKNTKKQRATPASRKAATKPRSPLPTRKSKSSAQEREETTDGIIATGDDVGGTDEGNKDALSVQSPLSTADISTGASTERKAKSARERRRPAEAMSDGGRGARSEGSIRSGDAKPVKRRGRKPKAPVKRILKDVEMKDIAGGSIDRDHEPAEPQRAREEKQNTESQPPHTHGNVALEQGKSPMMDFSNFPNAQEKKKPYSRRRTKDTVSTVTKQKEVDLVSVKQKAADSTSAKQKKADLTPAKQKETGTLSATRKEADTALLKPKETDSISGKQKEADLTSAKRKEADETSIRQEDANAMVMEQKEDDQASRDLEESLREQQDNRDQQVNHITRNRHMSREEGSSERKKDVDVASAVEKEQGESPSPANAPSSSAIRQSEKKWVSRSPVRRDGETVKSSSSSGQSIGQNAGSEYSGRSTQRVMSNGSPRRDTPNVLKRKVSATLQRSPTGNWLPNKALKSENNTEPASSRQQAKLVNEARDMLDQSDQEFTFTAPGFSLNNIQAPLLPRQVGNLKNTSGELVHDAMNSKSREVGGEERADTHLLQSNAEVREENVEPDIAMKDAISPVQRRNETREQSSTPHMEAFPVEAEPPNVLSDTNRGEALTQPLQSDAEFGRTSTPHQAANADFAATQPRPNEVDDEDSRKAMRTEANQSDTGAPLRVMTDTDEPFQAMKLCQQLQRSYWDFADTQDGMIDGFLSLLRRRSKVNRSRSGNDLLQAWASPDERQYLRRQKWYTEVNLARLELRRMQEQALEEFARKVSAAQESHVNTLGDFFLRASQGEQREGINDLNADPERTLRRASMTFAEGHTGEPLSRQEVFGTDTSRGNVRFSLPAVDAGAHLSNPFFERHSNTPAAFAMPNIRRQGFLQGAFHSDYRGAKGRPDNDFVPATRGGSSTPIRSSKPGDVDPAMAVENARSIPIAVTQSLPHDMNGGGARLRNEKLEASYRHSDPGGHSNFSTEQPSAPGQRSEILVKQSEMPNNFAASLKGQDGAQGKDEKNATLHVEHEGQEDGVKVMQGEEPVNGLMNSTVNRGVSGQRKRRSQAPLQKEGVATQKITKKRRKGRELDLGGMKLADNTSVQKWLGNDFANLGIDCFRAKAILKLCNRTGGMALKELCEALPFGRQTLRSRLLQMTTKGFLDEQQSTEVSKTGKSKVTSVFTTVGVEK